jgi:hypothetical protein
VAALSLVCLALYTLTSLVVGTRLILRSRHSGRLPELLMGLTYVASSGIGYPLAVASTFFTSRPALLAAVVVGEVLIVIGCSTFLFFNAVVFRPNAVWSMPAAALGSLVLAAGAAAVIAAYFSTSDAVLVAERSRAGTAAMLFALGAGHAWTAVEGLRHYRMMRKRLALGLADPVVANRFLLWGLTGLVSVAWNGVASSYVLAGANVGADPVPVLAISVGGLASAIMLVLIFMAPAWYVRWLGRERPSRALATA